MADNQSLETWIGKDVLIARSNSTEVELVRLQNLTSWGVVCTYQEAEVGEPVLLPWGSVSWVRLAVQEEVDALEENSRSS